VEAPVVQPTAGHYGYGTRPLLGRFCIPDLDKLPPELDRAKYDNLLGEFGLDDVQEIAEDLMQGRHLFGYCIFSCLGVLVVYALLMNYLTMPFVWVSLIATGLGVIGLSYVLHQYVTDTYGMGKIQVYLEEVSKEDPNWTAVAL